MAVLSVDGCNCGVVGDDAATGEVTPLVPCLVFDWLLSHKALLPTSIHYNSISSESQQCLGKAIGRNCHTIVNPLLYTRLLDAKGQRL